MLYNHAPYMEASMLPDSVWVEAAPRLFIALIGGEDVWHMMLDHWQGESWRTIGDRYGVSHATARNWVGRAKVKMRQAGLDADAIRSQHDRGRAPASVPS